MPGTGQSRVCLLREVAVNYGIGLTVAVLPACADIAVVAFKLLVLAGQPNQLKLGYLVVWDGSAEHVPAVLAADNLLVNVYRVEKEAHPMRSKL